MAKSWAKSWEMPAGETSEAGMPPIVRPARDEDDWDLIGLIAACWSEYPGCVLDVAGEMPWLRAPASAFASRGGRLWVAAAGDQADARVVGCVGWQPAADLAGIELRSLYVARAARRRGLGARLVGLVEGAAHTRGSAFVDLWSDTRFLNAHRLYERLGYRRLPDLRELHDLGRTTELHYRKAAPFGVPPAR